MAFNKIFDFEYENNFDKIRGVESVLIKGDLSRQIPKLSVLIPTYKRPDLLKRAINSALNQNTKINYDIVIVDNDDNFEIESDTQKLMDSYHDENIYYYKNKKNLGMDQNFNRAIELARGEYVAFLHDDDFFEPNFVEEAYKRAKGEKAVFFKYRTRYETPEIINAQSKTKRFFKMFVKILIKAMVYPIYFFNPKKNKIELWDMFWMCPKVSCIANVYNKKCLIKIGGFNPESYPGSDFELNIKYIMRYGAFYVKKTTGNYWIGANDSIRCCVIFPEFNHNIRMSLLKYLKKDKRSLKRLANAFLAIDIAGVKQTFKCNDSQFDPDVLKIANAVEEKDQTKIRNKSQIHRLVKFFK